MRRTVVFGLFSASCLGIGLDASCTDPVKHADPAGWFSLAEDDAGSPYQISGLIAGGYQFELGTDDENSDGALTVRPSIDAALSERDHLHVTFAVSGGDALNATAPFSLAPWGADLESDVENINGSDVDFLQTAWYRRTLHESDRGGLSVTIGFIDSTEFIDQNAFANDEYTQFLNEVFINGPVGFYQVYDLGAAVEWSRDAWSLNGVVMRVAENDDGEAFLFGGAQLGYTAENALGEGTARLVFSFASDEFLAPDGVTTRPLFAAAISADQRIGESLGVWTRLGKQDDRALVTHANLYSGGVDLSGTAWGREGDNAGLGYAYLDGGNDGISSTHAVEAYVRFAIDRALSMTLDVQRTHDHSLEGGTDEGWVLGGRMVLEF